MGHPCLEVPRSSREVLHRNMARSLATCGISRDGALTCGGSSQDFSLLYGSFGGHVPWLCPDPLLAKSTQCVPYRLWPGLSASGGPLRSGEVRTRWCHPWVSLSHRDSLARLAQQLSRVFGPDRYRATGSRAGRNANPPTAAVVAAGGSFLGVGELLGRSLLPVYRHLPAGGLRRPWPGRPVAAPGARRVLHLGRARESPERAQASSKSAPSSKLCDKGRELSLVRLVHVVGFRRWPGLSLFPRSALIGQIRMSLWSALVVSIRGRVER